MSSAGFSDSVVAMVSTMTEAMTVPMMAKMAKVMMPVVPEMQINRRIEPITVAMPMTTVPHTVSPPASVVPPVAGLNDHLAGYRTGVRHTCRHRHCRMA